ncbi:MAG TPA: hypothetical protein VHZ95_07620, partial [Polyangiales bacterium]|nr:hypothetical protein [Polyangiales bacterium]
LGPYREVSEAVFEAFDDIISDADDALAQRLGWARKTPDLATATMPAVRPGELVQIRRPGRRQPKLERVPGPSSDSMLEPVRSSTSTGDPSLAL